MNQPLSPPHLSSVIPPGIHCALDYAVMAPQFIPGPVFEYIAGGSGQGGTAAANAAAFAGWAVYPRLLRDVAAGHTKVTLSGAELPHPLLLAPVALQKLVHPLGELETARAAEAAGSCMIGSTLSSFSLEEIARSAGPAKWFQLYLQPQRESTLDLVRRAEAAGYDAVVLTLDAVIQVASLRALRAGFRMPDDVVPANLKDYPRPGQRRPDAVQSRVFQGAMRDAPTWGDLEWLLSQTTLPVWIKGVLHPEDARALKARGVAGLVVSNHGGRGLDGAPASLDAIAAVRAAVGPDYPLLLDGGIRSGSDVFKALALGADAVLVGRLQVYALGVAGALGVAHMLKLLLEELEVCMALAGCATLADIHRSSLLRVSESPTPEGSP
ncbi:MAG: alpha-hydroxy-acid oxidizing protein [Burkholderiales bacterium]|nr:alpha-hydroxy-acid oxidizing protein [Burkholderiales bacterium]